MRVNWGRMTDEETMETIEEGFELLSSEKKLLLLQKLVKESDINLALLHDETDPS